LPSWAAQIETDIDGVLLTEAEIISRVKAMAREISLFYQQQDIGSITVIGVLRGAFIFLADLVRQMELEVTIDFIAVSSYGQAATTSGAVRILKDVAEPLDGKHVLIIEDIIDSGLTLNYLCAMLRARQPASLKTCSFLSKPSRRQIELNADFCGFEIEDKFVVGYGLDFAGKYRHLPYIAVLKPATYQ